MNRRDALRLLFATAAATTLWPLTKAASGPLEARMTESTMPVIFLAHGSPMLLDSRRWIAELKQ